MEDGVGSADRASDVIKKKSSSGCLIIKKKGNGVAGFGASVSKKAFESRKEKKRPRTVLTDSGSSDELIEPIRRKVADKYYNGSVPNKKSYGEDTRIGFESERKRSGLDVFEFDEYDGFDGKKMRTDYMNDRLKLIERSANDREFEIGSSRNVVDRKKDIIYERKRSMSGGKSKGLNHSGKSMYEEEEDDESHLPLSFLREKRRESPSEPIRLQGKNGVLKVMVNKKKQGFPDKSSDYPRADYIMDSRSEGAFKKNEVIRPSFFSDSKRQGKPSPIARTDKSYLKSRKALSNLSSKAEDSETDDSDKQESSEQVQRSKKNEHKRATPTEILTPPRGGNESKVKRGNGTEKQLLREKIRSMLLDRGWRIDYRPRKNRDYLDAVYINPAGTAYWSIIKAYDALQKQLEEDEDNIKPCGESTSFTPLPEEIISKLTRQTRKKIEREMKKKKRDAHCSKNVKDVTMRESANFTGSEQQEEKLSFYMKHNHKGLKGRLHEADHLSGDDSSDSLYKGKTKQDMAEKQCATNSHMIQGRKSRKIGRCTLLVRSSDKGLNSEGDGFVPYTGKRTLLSWLIDSGIVHMSEKVQYMNRRKTKAMLEGWITRDGIHCGCCSKILTISKFEIHAGSKQRQPFPNIYLESGLSLMQCQIDAWNKQKESEREGFYNVDVDGDDPNDDTCGLCGDGGDLICCDGCPSTFHQNCLDIKMLPAGDWHCPNCTCKFCGFAGQDNAKSNDRTDGALLTCSLCEKKYHRSCNQEVDLSDDSGDSANSFCGKNCHEVFACLQKLLGVKHELESGFSWSLVHRMDPASETLHLGFTQRVECNSKLAVALSVMDECFLPIVDRRSGINLIHNVLYNCGSNFSRLDYSGFYTAILERGDETISAASIRIHGTQLAEMPFIGTRHIYRRQGMCRRLLSAIESALSSVKVEKLIIPAIAEHMHTWTKVFSFSPLEESHKQEMKSMNMLVFPGTDMLQKLLVKREITDGSIIAMNLDLQSTQAKENSLTLPMLGVKSELGSSPEHDLQMSDSTGLQPLTECSNKADASVSASQSPTVPSNNIPATNSSLISSGEPRDEISMDESHEAIVIDSTPVNNPTDSSTFLKSSNPMGNPGTLVTEDSVLDPMLPIVGVKSGLDSSPELDLHMNNTGLQPLNDCSNKAAASVSASQSPAVASNDIPATGSSLISYGEPKHGTAMDESLAINSTSVNNPADSAVALNSSCPLENPGTLVTEHSVSDPMSPMVGVISELDSSPAQDLHMSDDSGLQTLTEGRAAASVSASQSPTAPSYDIAATSISLISSGESKHESAVNLKSSIPLKEYSCTLVAEHSVLDPMLPMLGVKSALDSLPEHDLHMSDNTGVQPLMECCNRAASVSTSLPPPVPSNTIPATSSSLISSSEPKNETALDETLGIDSTLVDKLAESTVILKPLNPSKENHDTFLVENSVPGPYIQSSADAVINDALEEIAKADPFELVHDSLRETSASYIEKDATMIQNSVSVHDSVSHGTCEYTHTNSDRTDHTAVDLDNTCEVNVNNTFVDPPKDSLDNLSAKNTVNENVTPIRTIIEPGRGNVAGDTHEMIGEVTCLEPVTDSFNGTLAQKNTSQAICEDQSEYSSATDVVGDESNVDLENDDKGDKLDDAQEVDVEIDLPEPVIDSLNKNSVQSDTCQALNENLTGVTPNESSIDVKSDLDHQSLVDMTSDLHVATEVASNAIS